MGVEVEKTPVTAEPRATSIAPKIKPYFYKYVEKSSGTAESRATSIAPKIKPYFYK